MHWLTLVPGPGYLICSVLFSSVSTLTLLDGEMSLRVPKGRSKEGFPSLMWRCKDAH